MFHQSLRIILAKKSSGIFCVLIKQVLLEVTTVSVNSVGFIGESHDKITEFV